MRTIDTDVLIDKYGEWYTEEGTEEGYIGTVKGIVDSIPTIEPEPHWIPCSERLPIEAKHYLCSFNRPNRIDKIYVDLAYWTGGRWHGYMSDQINAWMPLPEAYREKGD